MVGQAAGKAKGWQTFSTVAVPGHTIVRATCAEVGCERLERGWRVNLDESLRAGAARANYIRHVTNRRGWTEHRTESGVTVFTFPPGTPCFCDGRDARAWSVFACGPHHRQVRHHLHVVSDGQSQHVVEGLRRWQARGNGARPPGVRQVYDRPDQWIDDGARSWNMMARTVNG